MLITVTTPAEARQAAAAGPDALIVQGGSAGGHAATTSPTAHNPQVSTVEVLRAVRAVVSLPLIAAGGVATAADVQVLRAAGAFAVQAGTAFLLADEAGTKPVHRRALTDGVRTETVVTRAFTGQPARALPNRFTDAHSATALVGYPAIHHLTAPIRAAAAAAGDADGVHLWAGTGFAQAQSGPVGALVRALTVA